MICQYKTAFSIGKTTRVQYYCAIISRGQCFLIIFVEALG